MRDRHDYLIVIGGTKMAKEIRGKRRLLSLINNFKRINKIEERDLRQVDALEARIKQRIKERVGRHPKECDDEHIFSLSLISNTRNVISKERRMSVCIRKIRHKVGHSYCPNLRIIHDEETYIRLRDTNSL